MNTKFKDLKIFAVPDRITAQSTGKGDHQKAILIIWESDEVSVELEGFLSKILSALQFNLNRDTFLINLKPGEKINLTAILQELQSNYLIVFGVPAKRMGLHFQYQLYQPFKHQQLHYLFADALNTLFEERQRGEKKLSGALWKALKGMFTE